MPQLYQKNDWPIASEILRDFHRLKEQGFSYQPWVQFSEGEFSSKHLNISVDRWGNPVRKMSSLCKDEQSCFRIFVFGGSTTFGYHVADQQTWPNYLQENLNRYFSKSGIEVTNYGRGIYYPSQQLALLIDLLRHGDRPNLVIFFDGVNLGSKDDTPRFTKKTNKLFQFAQGRENPPLTQLSAFRKIPLVKLISKLSNEQNPSLQSDSSIKDPQIIKRIFETNWDIASKLGEQYNFQFLVVLQPDAIYNYQQYRDPLPATYQQSRKVREELHKILDTKGEKFIDLRELFSTYNQQKKAILDDCHYTPEFNKFIATTLIANIKQKGIIANTE